MTKTHTELPKELHDSPLYSEDLAPVPASGRTWNLWSLAAIWVGMAVCIPTYLLASYMIKSGLGWDEALFIIFLANCMVTIPMILNGHAGVKYGIPFPVVGRAAFGTVGIHVPSIVRGIVACGWFGVQTWIGGLAFYAIWCALTGAPMSTGLSLGKFVGFALFWLLNLYFIWKGTESIRWLESFAAPILILIGLVLIGWAVSRTGNFSTVLAQSEQLSKPTAQLVRDDAAQLSLNPLHMPDGNLKAQAFRLGSGNEPLGDWQELNPQTLTFPLDQIGGAGVETGKLQVQFKSEAHQSSWITVQAPAGQGGSKWVDYLFWLTAMVGFWATMSISIADITRYVHTQREQALGQLIGLPGTMLLYSFVGVFVTCASLILFSDILAGEDAPWDPVTLLAKFEHPVVVIIAQIFMLIATLSTNIAANVIAPANAFANAFPRKVGFRGGGLITGVIGILIMPWFILDEISNLLILVSGFLGPVLGILVADYFHVRRLNLNLAELYKPNGIYAFKNGFNPAAMAALVMGVGTALIGKWVDALDWLYRTSWFSGALVAYLIYVLMMGGRKAQAETEAAAS